MKKFILIAVFFSLVTPAFADLINPHFSNEQRDEIKEARDKKFKQKIRNAFIYNNCGDFDTIDEYECKIKLQEEYKATLELLEKIVNETNDKKNEAANSANK